MKKLYLKALTTALFMLVGGVNSWADDYSSVYTRTLTGATAWTEDDKTAWTGFTLNVSGDYGLGAGFSNATNSAYRTFDIANNAKVKYVVDWCITTATGRDSNWNYIQFGDKIRIGINSTYNVKVSTDGGSTWNATSLGYYYNGRYTKSIEIIFNTATKSVESFSFDGTDRTALVSGVLDGVFNKITIGYSRGGSGYGTDNYLSNLAVSQCEQAVSMAGYTINYIYNGAPIKIVEEETSVGATVYADNPVTISAVKYYAKAGEVTSMNIVDGTNILNVDLRLAETWGYTLNAVDAEETILQELASGVVYEGETSSSLAYPRFILSGTNLYSSGSGAVTYSTTVTPNADSYVQNVNYTSGTISNVAFYTEGEDVTGATWGTNTARASKGNMGYTGGASTYLDVTTVAPGKYVLYMRGQNGNSTARAVSFKVGETEVFSTSIANGTNQDANSDEFTVSASSTLSFASEGSGQSGVDYFYLVQTAATATIGSTGYTTFASPYALNLDALPSGLEAYYITSSGVNAEYVTLTAATGNVPAGTGLILKGDAGSYNIPVATSGTALSGNLLVGCTDATAVTADANKYVLVANAGVAEFQSLATNAANVPAGKAYLSIPGGGAKARLSILLDGDATAIAAPAVAEAEDDAPVYNVAGQRVAANYKGIVIKNGKKYLNK